MAEETQAMTEENQGHDRRKAMAMIQEKQANDQRKGKP